MDFFNKHAQLLIQLLTMLVLLVGLYYGLDKRLAVIEAQTRDLPAHVQDIGQRVARLEGAQVIRPSTPSAVQ